jgi:hypothetical protein
MEVVQPMLAAAKVPHKNSTNNRGRHFFALIPPNNEMEGNKNNILYTLFNIFEKN